MDPPLCLRNGGLKMANKRLKPEEIVSKLRQVEVLTGKGTPRLDAIRQIGVAEQSYYRWRKQYGGDHFAAFSNTSSTSFANFLRSKLCAPRNPFLRSSSRSPGFDFKLTSAAAKASAFSGSNVTPTL